MDTIASHKIELNELMWAFTGAQILHFIRMIIGFDGLLLNNKYFLFTNTHFPQLQIHFFDLQLHKMIRAQTYVRPGFKSSNVFQHLRRQFLELYRNDVPVCYFLRHCNVYNCPVINIIHDT